MRRTLLFSAALTLLLAACGGGGEGGRNGHGGHGGEDDEGIPPDPRTLVEAVEVGTGAVGQYVVSSAVVESEAAVDLLPETNGIVTAVKVEEGDAVRKGQVLAVIENPNLEATLQRAQAELDRAEQTYGELQRLREANAVSERDLLDAHHALVTARTSHDEAQRMGAYTRLVSPIDGHVAARHVKYGQLVSSATPAFQVVDLGELRVVAQLPERDLASIRVGQPAQLVPVYDEELVVPGEVLRISPVVDSQTGTFRVTVAPVGDQQLLRPGQFVSVRIQVAHHEDTLVLPRRAVLYDRGEPYVFRVEVKPEEEEPEAEGDEEEGDEEEEGEPGFLDKIKAKFAEFQQKAAEAQGMGGEKDDELPGPARQARRVEIELGFLEVETVEVLGGLEPGDMVVSLGHEALRDEARVRLPEDLTMAEIVEQRKAEEEAKAEADEPSGEVEAEGGGEAAPAGEGQSE
jgi:membrane fusion protein (multidrug efflux system)